ncbi:MAG: sigma-70 family RNA polymerase sigma factor [Verrucomicrobia bacterium]|nr:sigma-70 family RNA polymerase sigma factor [Verrucomicrobiota bacterium]
MTSPATSALNSVLLIASMEQAASPSHLRELTSALAQGDDTAWSEFHRDYGPGLFRYLLGGTRGDYDLAAEALQQTYLRVARYARPCESAPMFSGWLRVVARSALNDCRRRRKNFWSLLRRSEAGQEEQVPESVASDNHVFESLDLALAQLEPAERALLEEKYFSGTDVRSLAARLNLTPKAVESRLTRARAELRRHLVAALSRHE